MVLDINKATTGYDAAGIKRIKNNFNAKIEQAIKKLRDDKQKVQDEVSNFWVGSSADVFKKNIDIDVENIAKALEDAKAIFQRQLYSVVNEMDAIDDGLVKARKN